jgi:hypothetical protein
MKNLKLSFFALLTLIVFTSCTNDDTPATEAPLGAYQNGILIVNEGNFSQDNTSISYLSGDLSTFQLNAFTAVNPSLTLGSTAQNINFKDDKAYVILNGSNKIEILNRFTLQHIATISSGLSNPRYIDFANGKGYITNWGDGSSATDDYIAILDLASNTLSTTTISVVEGPERIVENNGKLYVAHKGGYNFGNSISIINATNNTVENTITVGDVPGSLEVSNGYLYVLCEGIPSWTGSETSGKLYKINLSNTSEFSTLNYISGNHPQNLDIENGIIYYTNETSVYRIAESNFILPSAALFNVSILNVDSIYGFAVKGNKIFIGDPNDYSTAGEIFVVNENGSVLSTKTVGVSPNGFYFN